MQGFNYLDLAKNLADGHFEATRDGYYSPTARARRERSGAREWLGRQLIHLGERIAPRPADLRLEVSTGPPSP